MRPCSDVGGCGYLDMHKPSLSRVLTEERLYGTEKNWAGEMIIRNKVRIVTANYNFDVNKAREEYQKNQDEVMAVESHLHKEKALLREAFIMRQRRKMEPEPHFKKSN